MAAEDNAFTRILSRLDESDTGVTEKTASQVEPKSSQARMLEVVRSVSDSATKTASETPAPSASLEQMAKEAQQAEMDLLVKQSQHLGAALADGFMQRFAQYDAALSEQGVKTASTLGEDALQKAASAGYQRAVEDMNKQAADEYQRGYQDQMNQIHKIAADIHYTGQSVAHNIIEQLRRANQK